MCNAFFVILTNRIRSKRFCIFVAHTMSLLIRPLKSYKKNNIIMLQKANP